MYRSEGPIYIVNCCPMEYFRKIFWEKQILFPRELSYPWFPKKILPIRFSCLSCYTDIWVSCLIIEEINSLQERELYWSGGLDLSYLSVYISLSVHLGQFTDKGYKEITNIKYAVRFRSTSVWYGEVLYLEFHSVFSKPLNDEILLCKRLQ